MIVKQLRSRKIPQNQSYWEVIAGGKPKYLGNVHLILSQSLGLSP